MTLGPEHLEFSPPPMPALVGVVALVLAAVAHALLFIVLSLASHWDHGEPAPLVIQAELWPKLPTAPVLPAEQPAASPVPSVETTKEAPAAKQAIASLVTDKELGVEKEPLSPQQELQQRKRQQEQERRHQQLQQIRALEKDMEENIERPGVEERKEGRRDPT